MNDMELEQTSAPVKKPYEIVYGKVTEAVTSALEQARELKDQRSLQEREASKLRSTAYPRMLVGCNQPKEKLHMDYAEWLWGYLANGGNITGVSSYDFGEGEWWLGSSLTSIRAAKMILPYAPKIILVGKAELLESEEDLGDAQVFQQKGYKVFCGQGKEPVVPLYSSMHNYFMERAKEEASNVD